LGEYYDKTYVYANLIVGGREFQEKKQQSRLSVLLFFVFAEDE